jgi:hypothetical protein
MLENMPIKTPCPELQATFKQLFTRRHMVHQGFNPRKHFASKIPAKSCFTFHFSYIINSEKFLHPTAIVKSVYAMLLTCTCVISSHSPADFAQAVALVGTINDASTITAVYVAHCRDKSLQDSHAQKNQM